jgi:hypothetical protein
MLIKNINVTDLSEVTEFLDKKFSLMENQNKKLEIEESPDLEETTEESTDDSSPLCDNCGGEGNIGPLLEEECEECNGSGMSDPLYH